MLQLTSKIGVGIFVLVALLDVCSVEGVRRGGRKLHRSKRFIEWGPDIAGPYCEKRPGGCCPGRIDDCSVPILDTLCYCDEFCNRTRGDCCPDFFSFCHGQRTTPAPIRGGCTHDGRPYAPLSQIKINCQQCTCSPDLRSVTGFSFRCDGEVCLIRETIIDGVNNGRYGWRASNYSNFWGLTLRQGINYRLGTHKPDSVVLNMSPIKINPSNDLPRQFDAREKWRGNIHEIRDQGNCGASWAFSTTALAADRLSIESRGRVTANFSPQHMLSCDSHRQDGCNGGYLDRAWWYLRKSGVSTEECYPYVSGQTSIAGRCGMGQGRCPSGTPFRRNEIYTSTPPYRIAAKERDIMEEIYINGPVQATFRVKEDFFMYKSGVYRHAPVVSESLTTADEERSYHSVRIIGWGVDPSTNEKYWLCANSWGPYWGESGYFRIARGTNECKIETFVLGVWGNIENDIELQRAILSYHSERDRLRQDRENQLRLERLRQERRNQRRRRRRHLKNKHRKNKKN